LSFDLNGIDYGVASQDESLRHVPMYPTVDLGMGNDIAIIRSQLSILGKEKKEEVVENIKEMNGECVNALKMLDNLLQEGKNEFNHDES
jgi:hypothetical protein